MSWVIAVARYSNRPHIDYGGPPATITWEPDLNFGIHKTNADAKIAYMQKMGEAPLNLDENGKKQTVMHFNHLSRNLQHFKVIHWKE